MQRHKFNEHNVSSLWHTSNALGDGSRFLKQTWEICGICEVAGIELGRNKHLSIYKSILDLFHKYFYGVTFYTFAFRLISIDLFNWIKKLILIVIINTDLFIEL